MEEAKTIADCLPSKVAFKNTHTCFHQVRLIISVECYIIN